MASAVIIIIIIILSSTSFFFRLANNKMKFSPLVAFFSFLSHYIFFLFLFILAMSLNYEQTHAQMFFFFFFDNFSFTSLLCLINDFLLSRSCSIKRLIFIRITNFPWNHFLLCSLARHHDDGILFINRCIHFSFIYVCNFSRYLISAILICDFFFFLQNVKKKQQNHT